METTNKQQLRNLHSRLGTLLAQKKALNSKVTSKHFDLFREAAESATEPLEIKSRLIRLEQALKQEGLFKNVKGDFMVLKKEIIGSLYWTTENTVPRATLPGINPAKDKTFYIAPKGSGDNDLAISGSTATKGHGSIATDDMKMLNSTIGKLFRHLQISEKTSDQITLEAPQKDVNVLTVSHDAQSEETFRDITLKLRNFEKEFQRHKVYQQKEVMRLQEEVKRLNKNAHELKRENERIKGIQPILTKAKGKQVERIEERYRSERRGMEVKLNELEEGMKKNMDKALNDREEIRNQFDSFVSSVNHIHHLVMGPDTDHPHIKVEENTKHLPTKEILQRLTSVTGGIQVMKRQNHEMNKKIQEVSAWKKSLKEVEREITRFSRTYSDSEDAKKQQENTTIILDPDPQEIALSCKTKLSKTKDNINNKLKEVTDTTSILKHKEKDVYRLRKNMEELRSEISKLHDNVIAVQIQDISISMPNFERRHDNSDRSDESADELPEADREEQRDLMDKLRQIGTMVSHFQQLIIDRTTILNKMENDLLPLKVRVNRLHDDITKSVKTSVTSDDDPESDSVLSRRDPSPDSSTNVFAKEIQNMLAKLSKMELTFRHLLEQQEHNSQGRSSVYD